MLTMKSRVNTSAIGWRSVWHRLFRVEWVGQTLASLCWIVSTFAYGISSTGDWLQLCAASAWLVSNIARCLRPQDD